VRGVRGQRSQVSRERHDNEYYAPYSDYLFPVNVRWLASGGADFTLKIWDLNTGTCRCVCR
jgi:WD40 repeat protein